MGDAQDLVRWIAQQQVFALACGALSVLHQQAIQHG